MQPISLAELAAQIPTGCKLAIAKDDTGVAMAATAALVARRVRELHLVCVPIAGLQADVLIGAGCVSTVETSAVTLGEHGTGPRFAAALREGRVRILDATCPAIYAGLQAAQKGIPFMPLRGIIGSDLLVHRAADWRVVENPFGEDSGGRGADRMVAIRAIVPDVALFHAQAVDEVGNVFLGRDRDGLLLAHAARRSLVTVEQRVEGNLLDDPLRAGSVLPALYVSAVALAPRGAWPVRFGDDYRDDEAALAGYAHAARSDEGFARWLDAWCGSMGQAAPATAAARAPGKPPGAGHGTPNGAPHKRLVAR